MRSIVQKVIKGMWRRLPSGLRGRLLTGLIKFIAPRPKVDADPALPIIVVGYLHQASGLGAAARACHDALKGAGLPVYGIDLTSLLFQEANFDGFTFEDGRELTGTGTILLHLPGPQVALTMSRLGKKFVQRKHIVAHWFWELPILPQEWRSALTFVNRIFVNTHFVGDAVKKAAGNRSVQVVPYPLAATKVPMKRHTGTNPFTVLVIFNVASNFARKNPCAAIEAFRSAFGDDPSTRLIVKFTNAESWPQSVTLMRDAAQGAANIELVDALFNPAELDELYQRADAVLSLHRSEGLGLILAEAMARGLPVVATGWSGNSDFLTIETGFPIGYELVSISDPQGVYQQIDAVWAEPDIDEAAKVLQRLRDHPALRREIGLAAAEHITELFSPEKYAQYVNSLVK